MKTFRSHHILITTNENKNTFDQLNDYNYKSFKLSKNHNYSKTAMPDNVIQACKLITSLGISPKAAAITYDMPEKMAVFFKLSERFEAIFHIKDEDSEAALTRANWFMGGIEGFGAAIRDASQRTIAMKMGLDLDDASGLNDIFESNIKMLVDLYTSFEAQKMSLKNSFPAEILVHLKT